MWPEYRLVHCRSADLFYLLSTVCARSPVEQRAFAQQQLDHLRVAPPRRQMKRRQAPLVAFIKQTRVCDALQQSVTCVDAAVP